MATIQFMITGDAWGDGAKHHVIHDMLELGKDFVYASYLLEGKRGRTTFVAAHLQCQGMELIMKAALLAVDFDGYKHRFGGRKNQLGHDLIELYDEVRSALKLRKERLRTRTELETLNAFFKVHRLRYASFADIFVDPDKFECERSVREVTHLALWVQRRLAEFHPIYAGVYERKKRAALEGPPFETKRQR